MNTVVLNYNTALVNNSSVGTLVGKNYKTNVHGIGDKTYIRPQNAQVSY